MGFVVRLLRLLGPVLLVAGLTALFLAVARGEATLYFVVFVPVIVASGGLALVGVLLAFVGFFTTFLFWPLRPPEHPALEAPDSPVGGGVASYSWVHSPSSSDRTPG